MINKHCFVVSVFVLFTSAFLIFPDSLLSQDEDPSVIPSEFSESTVSFSEIDRLAFSDTDSSDVDSNVAGSDQYWIEKKRAVTVNSEIMAKEPFRLNLFPDHNYALIPDEFKDPERDDGIIIKSVSGAIIDRSNSKIGTGAVIYVVKDGETAYSGSFELDSGKVFELSTNETVELAEFKYGEFPPITCTSPEHGGEPEPVREELEDAE